MGNVFEKIKKIFAGTKMAYKKKGSSFIIRSGVKIILWYYYYKKFKSPRTFTFQGNIFNYFIHYYNLTWENERTVEIPIIWKIVNESRGKRILEVGNVLSNYFPVDHEILDKYEKMNKVINEDVCDFKPDKKYDLIVSISTLEHVGYDEDPREPMKILRAFKNLKAILSTKGNLVVTLPIGYNPELDKLLKNEAIPFTKMRCLKRISKKEWVEVDWNDICGLKYNYPFPAANGVVVGTIEKNE